VTATGAAASGTPTARARPASTETSNAHRIFYAGRDVENLLGFSFKVFLVFSFWFLVFGFLG
jgi:hypothetical protein